MTALPKLNNREIGRLAEIAEGKFLAWTIMRGTNESLTAKGLIRKTFVKMVCDSKVYRPEITDLGRQVLAAFPERTP